VDLNKIFEIAISLPYKKKGSVIRYTQGD